MLRTVKDIDLATRLVNTYPDSVAYDDNGNINFEETVYNFSVDIMDNMTYGQQKRVFKRIFDSQDECYDWLIMNLQTLRQELETNFSR